MNTDGEENAICSNSGKGKKKSLSSFKSLKNMLRSVTHTRYGTVNSHAKGSLVFMSRTRPINTNAGQQNKMSILETFSFMITETKPIFPII